MSCIRISLIAVLRLYGENEATNISRSECKKFDRDTMKNRNLPKTGWTFDRRETGNCRVATADGVPFTVAKS